MFYFFTTIILLPVAVVVEILVAEVVTGTHGNLGVVADGVSGHPPAIRESAICTAARPPDQESFRTAVSS